MVDVFHLASIEDQRSYLAPQPVGVAARDVRSVKEHRSDARGDLLDVEDADRLNILLVRTLVLSPLEIEAEVVIGATRLEIALKSFDCIERGEKLMLVALRLPVRRPDDVIDHCR